MHGYMFKQFVLRESAVSWSKSLTQINYSVFQNLPFNSIRVRNITLLSTYIVFSFKDYNEGKKEWNRDNNALNMRIAKCFFKIQGVQKLWKTTHWKVDVIEEIMTKFTDTKMIGGHSIPRLYYICNNLMLHAIWKAIKYLFNLRVYLHSRYMHNILRDVFDTLEEVNNCCLHLSL